MPCFFKLVLISQCRFSTVVCPSCAPDLRGTTQIWGHAKKILSGASRRSLCPLNFKTVSAPMEYRAKRYGLCGAFCSTSIAAMQVECGEMPLEIRRTQQELMYSLLSKLLYITVNNLSSDKTAFNNGTTCNLRQASSNAVQTTLLQSSKKWCIVSGFLHNSHKPSGCACMSCRYAFNEHLPNLSLVAVTSLLRVLHVPCIFDSTPYVGFDLSILPTIATTSP